jgi:2,4-dienoyl-CoA reductase-like NADH-dependent reductase (Old Yellow Enzyme family)
MNLPDEYPTVSDEYLDKLQEGYLEAAELAFDAGFDGVDIKACHGYLINELLASYQREGRYGGSFENRTRFLLEVIGKIKDRLGDEKVVTTRLGIYDGIPYPYGWGVDRQDYHKPDLAEPLKLVGLLEKRGVDMINISIANPYYNPHFNRPFTRQKQANEEISEHPLTGVERIIKLAGVVQRTYPDLTVIGSGYSWLGTLLPHVAAGAKEEGLATIIGAGRMAIAYPDFVRDIIQKGRLDADRICTTCGACSELMRADKPTGCVVRDGEVYGRRNE